MEPRHLAPRPLREPGSPAGGHDDDTDPGIPRHLAGGRRGPAPDEPPAGPGERPGAPVSSSRWVPTPGLVAGAAAILGLIVVLGVIASQNGVFPEREDALGSGDAVILGLVEGITEWLPISSTGHLTVTQDLLGIDGDAADSYAIAIQAGAILAVLGLYRARFASMVEGVLGRDPVGRNTAIAVVIACLPAVLVALVAEDAIKENLFGGWPVILAWAVGGVVILLVARQRRSLPPDAGNPLSSITWRHALIIGCVQVLALWPGVSRRRSSSASCSASSCWAGRRPTRCSAPAPT
jgi:hypothetical protein